jgi:hypothetical protein
VIEALHGASASGNVLRDANSGSSSAHGIFRNAAYEIGGNLFANTAKPTYFSLRCCFSGTCARGACNVHTLRHFPLRRTRAALLLQQQQQETCRSAAAAGGRRSGGDASDERNDSDIQSRVKDNETSVFKVQK